ncbi:MAG: hypothetical protein HWN66_12810 [Candidatus Helarchaeota archaeon]|nr:hypothetical protein [Candidatus Helarchaeota archaeon]
MGIFSRLKEFFSGKSIEFLTEFEPEIKKLQKKSNSEIIALIGTHGRLKGLPLIYAATDESEIRRYTAQLTEIMGVLPKIDDEKIIRDVLIRYYESILYYKPIIENVSFFALASHKTDVSILEQWVNSNIVALREVLV